jgi:DNA-binding transcriptional MocR family regulator
MGLSQAEIQRLLRTHQKRLQMGDSLPSISELADRAGIHRDTLYQSINGDRINQVSQIRLERMLKQLSQESHPPSRLMHINLSKSNPVLGFGVGPMFNQSKRPQRRIWYAYPNYSVWFDVNWNNFHACRIFC